MGLSDQGTISGVPGIGDGNMFACDVGNSRVSLGLVVGWRIAEVIRVPLSGLDGLAAVVLASAGGRGGGGGEARAAGWPVVGVSVNSAAAVEVGKMLISAGALPMRLAGEDFAIPLPLSQAMPEPQRVGRDRLLAALGAWRRHNGAAVVVDVGTAITIDSVSSSGVFQGGAIMPGPAVAAWSLHARTAALPEVSPVSPGSAGASDAVEPVGRDTQGAIRAGLIYGIAGGVDRLVEEQLSRLPGGAVTVATGGGYKLLQGYLRSAAGAAAAYVENLVLEGLVAAVREQVR